MPIGTRTFVATFTLGVLLLGACSSKSEPQSGSSPEKTSIAVAVQEWAVLPAQASAAAGTVTFTVKNTGPAYIDAEQGLHADGGELRVVLQHRGEQPRPLQAWDAGRVHRGLAIASNGCTAIRVWPCTRRCPVTTSASRAPGSGPATSRHTPGPAYRCFLPDLTGFTGWRCARPGLQHPRYEAFSRSRSAGGDSAPLERIAGTGHRWLPA